MVNGTIIRPASTRTEEEDACVVLLENLLIKAKAGEISSLGVVYVNKGGFNVSAAGAQLADVHMGAGLLQKTLLDFVVGGNGRRPSPIVRARG